ncbi:hypothetical protein C2845_PM01G04780 [Panicum miliaceum]|uniref:Uncharacterized protein n=1 Tax=Panicum miliaceum TaxID=4540 RepID=A0A3L6TQ93_PANMI|nr:hypothetical protein C2845_PM01G04780 [Panicum miliaceum]
MHDGTIVAALLKTGHGFRLRTWTPWPPRNLAGYCQRQPPAVRRNRDEPRSPVAAVDRIRADLPAKCRPPASVRASHPPPAPARRAAEDVDGKEREEAGQRRPRCSLRRPSSSPSELTASNSGGGGRTALGAVELQRTSMGRKRGSWPAAVALPCMCRDPCRRPSSSPPGFRPRAPAAGGPRTVVGGAPGGVFGCRRPSRYRGDAGARSPFSGVVFQNRIE